MDNVSIVSIAVGGSAVFCMMLMSWLYWRKERRLRQQEQQAKTNIADMAILFQTMRDIVRQQKSLAKEFNLELEEKSKGVQAILARGLLESQTIQETQRQANAEIEARKEEIDMLRRHIARLHEEIQALKASLETMSRPPARATPPPPPRPASQPALQSVPPHATPAPVRAAASVRPVAAAPANKNDEVFFSVPSMEPGVSLRNPSGEAPPAGLPPRRSVETAAPNGGTAMDPARMVLAQQPRMRQVLDPLAGTGLTRAPFETWQGDTFPEESAPVAVPRPPASPSDADAARSAFRALLNMDAEAPLQPAPQKAGEEPSASRPNGIQKPLQQRIVEYSNAGMSVAAIASELGIGKGEVRLMLNLARGAE
ncbi:MAG: hypothetical protein HYV27_18905 [Candidatus Hydrogenedentes bacterium]|nr:hypothetical protein [Candidatus Hydrogenedentota bacterium]